MSGLQRLNRTTAKLPANRPVKVLQFGEGNFLRAFVDWMVDILNEKTAFNGNVQIVQPLPQGMGEKLNGQDGLYHVVLNGIRRGEPVTESRLVTCVTGVINPYLDYQKYLKAGENPDLQFVVSNTTEAGIAYDPADKSHETIPSSFPGKLTALLFHRFIHFAGAADKAVTIIPCELIDRNGDKLREAILKYATAWKLPSGFSDWISQQTTFCNTLVDRIVPGFPAETIKQIQEKVGYADELVVMAEPFHLWVIEAPPGVSDRFPADRAGLDVKFVKDQTPYRLQKVRILNGAHTAMVPIAYLRGLRTVSESVNDPYMKSFLQKVIFEETIPVLNLPHGELLQFANDVIERFQNPFIRHELISIALNSISKFKVRVLPTILEFRERKGNLPANLINAFAGLLLFYKGEFNGQQIPLADSADVIQFMKEAWQSNNPAVIADKVLANRSFWDQDLTSVPGLKAELTEALKRLPEQLEA